LVWVLLIPVLHRQEDGVYAIKCFAKRSITAASAVFTCSSSDGRTNSDSRIGEEASRC